MMESINGLVLPGGHVSLQASNYSRCVDGIAMVLMHDVMVMVLVSIAYGIK